MSLAEQWETKFKKAFPGGVALLSRIGMWEKPVALYEVSMKGITPVLWFDTLPPKGLGLAVANLRELPEGRWAVSDDDETEFVIYPVSKEEASRFLVSMKSSF